MPTLTKPMEVMQCLVWSFAESGRLKEAVGMVFEMQNYGLNLKAEIGFEMGFD